MEFKQTGENNYELETQNKDLYFSYFNGIDILGKKSNETALVYNGNMTIYQGDLREEIENNSTSLEAVVYFLKLNKNPYSGSLRASDMLGILYEDKVISSGTYLDIKKYLEK